MPVFSRCLILVFVVALVGGSAAADPLPHPNGSENLTKLYQFLEHGTIQPDLLLDPVDDTLQFGQFYPQEKFEIIRRGGEYFIPLAIYTGRDTCQELVRYIEPDPTQRYAHASLARYMVPLSELGAVLELDCIVQLEDEAPVRLMTMEERGRVESTYYVSLVEDYATGKILLDCWTRGDVQSAGWKIQGTIKIPTDQQAVIVQPSQTISGGAPDPNRYPAHGVMEFEPPADKFHLVFGGDAFVVTRTYDSVFVVPVGVCDNMVLPDKQQRLPANMFGLVFSKNTFLRGLQPLPDRNLADTMYIDEAQRDALIQPFLDFRAYPVMVNGLELPVNSIHRRESLNFLDESPTYRAGRSRPVLLFTYDGDMEEMQYIFDGLSNKPDGMELWRQRW